MDKPKLLIVVQHPQIEVVLLKDQQEIDKIAWQDGNDLSLTLLLNIDKLLKRNKIKILELSLVEVQAFEASYTSARIAQAVANTVNYSLTNFK